MSPPLLRTYARAHHMSEDGLVLTALRILQRSLPRKCDAERAAALLYQVQVDGNCDFVVNPLRVSRGHSAFQTDLCVFEQVAAGARIPRVVLEFKTALSTHDILTYTTKARRHKQVYPYLRYGIVAGRETRITSKFFNHNEALDFCLAAGAMSRPRFAATLRSLVKKELSASRRLQAMAFDGAGVILFRTDITVREP